MADEFARLFREEHRQIRGALSSRGGSTLSVAGRRLRSGVHRESAGRPRPRDRYGGRTRRNGRFERRGFAARGQSGPAAGRAPADGHGNARPATAKGSILSGGRARCGSGLSPGFGGCQRWATANARMQRRGGRQPSFPDGCLSKAGATARNGKMARTREKLGLKLAVDAGTGARGCDLG